MEAYKIPHSSPEPKPTAPEEFHLMSIDELLNIPMDALLKMDAAMLLALRAKFENEPNPPLDVASLKYQKIQKMKDTIMALLQGNATHKPFPDRNIEQIIKP